MQTEMASESRKVPEAAFVPGGDPWVQPTRQARVPVLLDPSFACPSWAPNETELFSPSFQEQRHHELFPFFPYFSKHLD